MNIGQRFIKERVPAGENQAPFRLRDPSSEEENYGKEELYKSDAWWTTNKY